MGLETPEVQPGKTVELMNLKGINGRPDLMSDVAHYMEQHGISNFKSPYGSGSGKEDKLLAEWIVQHPEASVDMNSEAIGAVRNRVDALNFAMRDRKVEEARYEMGLIKQLLDKIEAGLKKIEA